MIMCIFKTKYDILIMDMVTTLCEVYDTSEYNNNTINITVLFARCSMFMFILSESQTSVNCYNNAFTSRIFSVTSPSHYHHNIAG